MRYAKDFDGTIRIYSSIPKKYDQDFAFYLRNIEEWNAKGFYEVVEVSPSETQKAGAIYFDATNDVFTFPLIDLTQLELDENAERKLNQDISQTTVERRRLEGMRGFDKIKAIIERMFRKGEITGNQALNADAYFHPLVKDLNFGSWHIVQGRLNAEEPNVPAGYQTLFNQIKNKVDTYINNSF